MISLLDYKALTKNFSYLSLKTRLLFLFTTSAVITLIWGIIMAIIMLISHHIDENKTSLQEQITELSNETKEAGIIITDEKLISSTNMLKLLKNLTYGAGLANIVSFKQLKTVPIGPLYEHILDIKLKGNYFELLSYLQSIAKHKYIIIWDTVSFNALNFPTNELTLTIGVLSKEKV